MPSENEESTGPDPISDDVELVRRARAREPEAVDALIERLAFLRALVTRRNARLGMPIDASELEDVLQEVYLSVWTRLGRFHYGRFEPWVVRFAVIEFLARVRLSRRCPSPLEDVGLREPSPAAEQASAEERLIELGPVYRALEELGPPENEVIRLKLLEDLSFPEVAARLVVPVNTAKARYYRGLRRLRGRLARAARSRREELRA